MDQAFKEAEISIIEKFRKSYAEDYVDQVKD